jgi:hypothetical protein
MFSSKRNQLPESLNYTPVRPVRRRTPFWAGDITSTYVFKLLKRMEAASEHAESLRRHDLKHRLWTLPFRRELRLLFAGYDTRVNVGEVDIVRSYLLTCPPAMIPICVWLIGHFRSGMPIHELASLRHSLSPSVRRHLAKTLRRLEAWSLLRVMAGENPNDDRIQWFATAPTTHRPFLERLEIFAASLDDSHAGEVATPSRMPYWEHHHRWTYTPPKSVATIRHFLRRIRHLVRWGVT